MFCHLLTTHSYTCFTRMEKTTIRHFPFDIDIDLDPWPLWSAARRECKIPGCSGDPSLDQVRQIDPKPLSLSTSHLIKRWLAVFLFERKRDDIYRRLVGFQKLRECLLILFPGIYLL